MHRAPSVPRSKCRTSAADSPAADVTGLILAGGLARRMGGRDKGLLTLSGRPLIAHVFERLAPQVARVLVSANRNGDSYARFGAVVPDLVPDYAGPLAGLHAGLRLCATPFLAAVPCDAPRLPVDLVARLHAALVERGGLVAAPFAAGRLQPAFLLCRTEAGDALQKYLGGGGRRIHAWLDEMEAVAVPFADDAAFANVNTPEDLAALEHPG